MQFYPPCDSTVGEEIFNDERTQARVNHLKKQTTARVRTSPSLPEGVPAEEIPCIRWGDSMNPDPAPEQTPLVRWDGSATHYLGSPRTRSSSTMQRLHGLLKAHRYDELRDELARAESTGEISEFYALNSHAILAMVEGSEFANDYLEMAEAVASSPYELAVIAENRTAHDLLQGDPFRAAEHCLAILDRVYQTEGLWNNFLIALYRLGEMKTTEATPRSFTQLGDECAARLVGLLSSEPELRELRVRPAFRELLDSRVAG